MPKAHAVGEAAATTGTISMLRKTTTTIRSARVTATAEVAAEAGDLALITRMIIRKKFIMKTIMIHTSTKRKSIIHLVHTARSTIHITRRSLKRQCKK